MIEITDHAYPDILHGNMPKEEFEQILPELDKMRQKAQLRLSTRITSTEDGDRVCFRIIYIESVAARVISLAWH